MSASAASTACFFDALRNPLHLAVTDGPGTGGCLGVPTAGVVVGRAHPEDDQEFSAAPTPSSRPQTANAAQRPPLSDPLLSRSHFEAQSVPTRDGYVLRARDLGSTNGVRIHKPRRPAADGTARWRRGHRLGRRWRVLPLGTLLCAGATRFEVRARPGEVLADETPRFAGPVPAPDKKETPPPSKRRLDVLLRVLPTLMMAVMLVPLLAMRGSSPWRWLLLALPLVIMAAALASILGRRTSANAERPLDAAALGMAIARGQRSEAAPGTLPWHLPNRPTLWLADGETIGVYGPHASDAALWIALRAWFSCAPGACEILCGDDASPTASLSGPSAAPPAVGVARRGWRVIISGAAEVPSTTAQHYAPPGRHAATNQPGASSAIGVVRIVVARHRQGLPPWCTHVVAAPQEASDIPAGTWTTQVLALAAPAQTSGSVAATPALLGELLDPALVDGLRAGGARAAGAVRRAWRGGALRPRGVTADGAEPSHALRAKYADHPGDLSVVLGSGPDGPCAVDLIADGPHALVAGTTGSGKSEALVSWVLQLALTHDPRELQFFLLDHKGGATFGDFATLPHTTGLLTDLDAAATDRALRSLTAEVARRERLLAEAGVRDLRDLEVAGLPGPPRLLVIADEFRVLADTHPDLMDGLRRLAAQGRTLGMHLVLATQRPAGALSADLRANIPLRLCLRVVEAADSTDVLGVAHAAELPPVPGLAYLRSGTLQSLRVAWAGGGALTRAVVSACREAWAALVQAGAETPPRPWAPPLPTLLRTSDLATFADAPATPGSREPHAPSRAQELLRTHILPLGLADLPDEQRLAPAGIDPRGGVLVLGDRGSGRTSAIRTLLGAALDADWCTHLLTAGSLRVDELPPLVQRRGTWLDARDAARARSLIEAILDGRSPAPTLVAIDDADAVADLLDVGRSPGTGLELLERLVRDASRVGACVVAAGSPALTTPRWAAPLANRLVLAVRDDTQAGMIGVPPPLRSPGAPPGRAVLLTREPARVVQLVLRPAGPAGPATAAPSVPPTNPATPHEPETPKVPAFHATNLAAAAPIPRSGELLHSTFTGAWDADFLNIPPLPVTLGVNDFMRAAARSKYHVGCSTPINTKSTSDAMEGGLAVHAAAGCDGTGPVLAPLDVARPWVITGPPGSGRSTLLRALAAWLSEQGRPHVEIDSITLHDPAATIELATGPEGTVALVDDADAIALARLAELCTPQTNIACAVVTSEHAVGIHASGLPARALAVGTILATDPRRSALPEIRAAADPHHHRHAVLLHRGRARRFVPPEFAALPNASALSGFLPPPNQAVRTGNTPNSTKL